MHDRHPGRLALVRLPRPARGDRFLGPGFTERAVHAEGEAVVHAELTWPGTMPGGVMLGPLHPADDPCGRPPGGSSIHIVVDGDVDARFARAVAAGATPVREPEDTDYGGRSSSPTRRAACGATRYE